ncbi:MAG: tetratricopeptide repeat protein [Deltaproteobacteria bacterium]|nr:tetratricopeptide repeat protein [Deltaproteobacteria bacterium]
MFLALLALALTGSTAGALAAEAASPLRRISAVVLPPFAEGAAGRELALGIADRAGAELFATGSYKHFHLRQVLAAARRHGMDAEALGRPAQALRAVRILAAASGAFGSLQRRAGGGWTLVCTAFDTRSGKRIDRRAALPADTARALMEGGRLMASALADLHAERLTGPSAAAGLHPHSSSGPAVEAYLACYAVLVDQPLGLRTSLTLDPQRIAEARSSCKRAVELDPDFAAAWAALSLAQALAFENQAAAEALGKAQRAKGYLPYANIARYWLATRFRSSAEGARVLREAVRVHPGALIFAMQLGEHLNITGRYAEALETWEQVLDMVPGSPYALAQKGYSLARLGRLEESIATSRTASDMDPDCLDLKLELASRLVDARKLDEAEALLLPMCRDPRCYGEILLRLGYVYLLERKDDKAEDLFGRALAMAKGPDEWRTRGRARYDLAIVSARRGKLGEAERHLLAAAEEGFIFAELIEKDPDLEPLSGRAAIKTLGGGKRAAKKLILHATPFPVDFAGKPVPDAARPQPPQMTGVTF